MRYLAEIEAKIQGKQRENLCLFPIANPLLHSSDYCNTFRFSKINDNEIKVRGGEDQSNQNILGSKNSNVITWNF